MFISCVIISVLWFYCTSFPQLNGIPKGLCLTVKKKKSFFWFLKIHVGHQYTEIYVF